jgi:hypothetical protein
MPEIAFTASSSVPGPKLGTLAGRFRDQCQIRYLSYEQKRLGDEYSYPLRTCII